jgi:hypothetical protein
MTINVGRYASSDSTIRLNQSSSDVHLPLRSGSPSKNPPWDAERDTESSSSHTHLYAPQPKRPHVLPYGGIADSQMREIDHDAQPRDSFDSVGWDPSSKAGPQGRIPVPLQSPGDTYSSSNPFVDSSTESNPFGSTTSLHYPTVPPGLPSTKQQQQQQPPSPSQTPVARPTLSSPGASSPQAPRPERWHAPGTSEDVTAGSLPSPPWDSAPHEFGATGSESSTYTHRTEATDASYHTARSGRLSDSTDLPYR